MIYLFLFLFFWFIVGTFYFLISNGSEKDNESDNSLFRKIITFPINVIIGLILTVMHFKQYLEDKKK